MVKDSRDSEVAQQAADLLAEPLSGTDTYTDSESLPIASSIGGGTACEGQQLLAWCWLCVGWGEGGMGKSWWAAAQQCSDFWFAGAGLQ